MADAEFDRRRYVERYRERRGQQPLGLAEEILEVARNWVSAPGPGCVGWISLDTEPARGNTWLLHDLAERFRGDYLFRFRFNTALVPAATSDAPSPPLGPLQETLTAPLRDRGLTNHQRRLLQAIAAHPFLFPLLVLGVPTALVLGATITQYLTDERVWSLRHFLMHYMPQNIWRMIPVAMIGVILGVLPSALTRILQRSPGNDELQEIEIKRLQSLSAMVDGLVRLIGKRQGIVLLIDRAHLLREAESLFLMNLAKPETRPPELVEFFAKYQVLIVTVDEVKPWVVSSYRTVVVPQFGLTDLREIAKRQGKAAHDRVKDDTEEASGRLEEARRDIHSLFGGGEHLLADISLHYRRAQEESPNDLAYGLDAMMVYQAVRVKSEGTVEIPKGELGRWLKRLNASSHLRDFQIESADTAELVKSFPRTTLARPAGNQLVFDVARCRALLEWARDERHQDEAFVAARAYLYWWREAVPAITDDDLATVFAPHPPLAWRQKMKRAAWLLMELTKLPVSGRALLDTMRQAQREKTRSDAALTLVLASIVHLREGDTTLAIGAAEDVIDWIGADGVRLDVYATHLWEMYWLTASPIVLKTLTRLREAVPSVVETQAWRIESRFQAIVHGEEAEAWKLPRKQLSEWLLVRGALAESIRASRVERGVAFAQALHPRGEPLFVTATLAHSSAPIQLWMMRATRAVEGEREDAIQLLDEWKTALPDTSADCCVGDEPLQWYALAMHLHARVRAGMETGSSAEEAYNRALLLASVLNWQALTSEISYFLGVFLVDTTDPVSDAGTAPWKRWETAFQSVLAVEKEAAWYLFTPEVLLSRWHEIRAAAVDRSLTDGWAAYQALKRSHACDEVLLEMHGTLQDDFNTCADSDEARDLSGDLQLEWAESLASKADSARWTMSSLEAEQALHFSLAAQARRLSERFSAVPPLIERAAARLEAVAAESPDRREVELSIGFQWMCLYQDEEKWEEFAESAAALWAKLQITDSVYPVVLSSRLGEDSRRGLLRHEWPADANGQPAADPEAPHLSLSPQWMKVCGVTTVATRYEYRFWQLHQTVAHVQANPANFASAIMNVAEHGVDDAMLLGPIRPFVVQLLDGALNYYVMEHIGSKRIDTLRLLMIATDHSPEYYAAYRVALNEFAQLVEHERKVLADSPMQWYLLANRIHRYFHFLVDTRRAQTEMIRTFDGARVDAGRVIADQEEREREYEQAREALNRRDLAGALRTLDHALPGNDALWVFWSDLDALSVWMRCAESIDTGAKHELRAQQLRAFAMRYVRQLSRSVDDTQVQIIAVRLLRLLEASVDETQRLPVARSPENLPPPEHAAADRDSRTDVASSSNA